eukprot:714537-Pleurochrysis_carterae.AAC.1
MHEPLLSQPKSTANRPLPCPPILTRTHPRPPTPLRVPHVKTPQPPPLRAVPHPFVCCARAACRLLRNFRLHDPLHFGNRGDTVFHLWGAEAPLRCCD